MCASDDDNEEENQKIDDEVKKIRALRGDTDWGRGGGIERRINNKVKHTPAKESKVHNSGGLYPRPDLRISRSLHHGEARLGHEIQCP